LYYLTHLRFVPLFCRSRLAAASVLLPSSEGLDQEVRRDVIQLLCSIFLANQGESEVGAGEDKNFELVGNVFQFFLRILVSHVVWLYTFFIPYFLMR
jgi:hypothetical protein